MRFAAASIALGLVVSASSASALELLSNTEWNAELAEQAKPHAPKRSFGVKAANAYPKIIVESPVAFDAVPSPITITVKFDGGGHAVDPATFKVLYGWLKLDITERLKSAVKIDPKGFSISGADLPAGTHSLLLRIADVEGQESSTEVSFKVVTK